MHPVPSTCDADRRTTADYAAFVAQLEEGARRKGEWTHALLAEGGWDLLMQVFTEGHCAGHQCWHLHDATHPAHDAAIAAALGDPLKRAYQAIDRAIGRVLEAAGDARIVVFSAHGMSHWYGAQFLLPRILEALGATVPPPAAAPVPRPAWERAARAAWRRLPEGVRSAVRGAVRRVRPEPPPPPPAIHADFARSRCFPQPNGLAVGGIRLNLAGREPQGVLRPGEEAEAFVQWLTTELTAITDARTGGPLVRRVRRTAELYAGEHLALLPDLLVEWSDAVPTGATTLAGGVASRVRATSPAIGVVEGANEYARTGEHRPGGWLLAAGPGIAAGRLDAAVALADLAPTFTAMLGVTLEGADGEPIGALVRGVGGGG